MRTVDDLCTEILVEVFEFAAASLDPMTCNLNQVVSLMRVCRRWMAILCSNGRIWSNVHIRGQDLATLDAQLTLCRKAPLFVLIKVPPRDAAKYSCYLDFQKNIQGAVSLIRERRDQVKRLEVHMDCQTLREQLGCEWSNLEELVWVDTCPLGSSVHGVSRESPVPGGFPMLKILSIGGCINWSINAATNLTTFKLKGPIRLELPTLIKFFRRNTSLQSLELMNLDVWGPPNSYRVEPIELPRLTNLSIHNATCGCMLPLLNLPLLNRLWVFSLKGRNPWSDYDWSKLCNRLSITNIEVQYSASIRETITMVGSNGLDTQSFHFTEVSPATHGAALFRLFSSASLPSVTSVTLIKNMPEGGVSSSLTAAICDLLEQLPRVERMRVYPSGLAVEVTRHLSENPELCPELRELEVTVTGETCTRTVEGLVAKVVKVRADSGDGREMRRIECLHPAGSQRSGEVRTRVVWDRLWKAVEVGKHERRVIYVW